MCITNCINQDITNHRHLTVDALLLLFVHFPPLVVRACVCVCVCFKTFAIGCKHTHTHTHTHTRGVWDLHRESTPGACGSTHPTAATPVQNADGKFPNSVHVSMTKYSTTTEMPANLMRMVPKLSNQQHNTLPV